MPYPLGHGAACHLQRRSVCGIGVCFGSMHCFFLGRCVWFVVCVCVRVPWSRVLRAKDTLAEWLRRRPAKPMGSPRVGSNPTGVGLQLAALRRFDSANVDVQKRGCSGN
jgi:hypothetical protein